MLCTHTDATSLAILYTSAEYRTIMFGAEEDVQIITDEHLRINLYHLQMAQGTQS